MAKLKILSRLAKGQKVTGRVNEVSSTAIVLEDGGENKIRVTLPAEICEILEEDYVDEIVTIENNDGEFIIEDHDDFPE